MLRQEVTEACFPPEHDTHANVYTLCLRAKNHALYTREHTLCTHASTHALYTRKHKLCAHASMHALYKCKHARFVHANTHPLYQAWYQLSTGNCSGPWLLHYGHKLSPSWYTRSVYHTIVHLRYGYWYWKSTYIHRKIKYATLEEWSWFGHGLGLFESNDWPFSAELHIIWHV